MKEVDGDNDERGKIMEEAERRKEKRRRRKDGKAEEQVTAASLLAQGKVAYFCFSLFVGNTEKVGKVGVKR